MSMANFFLELLNRSITAGWLILAVIVLRLLLRRAPRWSVCLLWGLVAFRLVCPFSVESIFSVIPSRETLRQESVISDPAGGESADSELAVSKPAVSASSGAEPAGSEPTGAVIPVIDSGMELVDHLVNPLLEQSFRQEAESGVRSVQAWLTAAGAVWAVVAGSMLLYALAGYVRLRLKMRTAVRLKEPVYLSEFADTPFILGVFRPRVYLPTELPDEMREPVTAHELAHLKRGDHFWKVFGYALLAVYWFHPLCWAAYILFGRDIELACDEKVVKDYEPGRRKAYSEALLACSVKGRHVAAACPLAFGEVGVRERIRAVLNYKKPTFWLVAVAAAACVAAAVCFLTDPVREDGGKGAQTAGNGTQMAENGMQAAENGEEGKENPAEGSELQESLSSAVSDKTQDSEQFSEEAADEERLQAFLRQWTERFVNRDGEGLVSMASEETAADLRDRGLLAGAAGSYTFGRSDLWPADGEEDVLIYESRDTVADIYYYAWDSDPHATVWKERLFYEERDGEYVVTGESLEEFQEITTPAQYRAAYPDGMINGTRIDYQINGALDTLERNALLSSGIRYLELWEPESAAAKLLNLSRDPQTVGIERVWTDGDTVGLEITFPQEGGSFRINMVQGTDTGVWIPQDYHVNPTFWLKQVDWEAVKRENLSVGSRDDSAGVICLGRIPDREIVLYGCDNINSSQGVAVEIGTERYFFDWIYTSPRNILPECRWDEENGRLQVALGIYTGTGADAQELHVLTLTSAGLTDNVLELNDFADLLYERIQFLYDETVPHFTLLDGRDQTELATVETFGEPVRELELGSISHFILGKKLFLRVSPGYYLEGSYGVAEYENMPELEAEILMEEDSQGKIVFELGDIYVVQAVPAGDVTGAAGN
ncbi:MAG: hypothetical protein NC541_15660 [bacterium]|nr:hypothetical protein [bacterium]